MTHLEQKIETKEHILQVALELFALYGFEGTSVRSIAEKAEVNIAAINYHFKSKHNLYWAVMAHSSSILKKEIEKQVQSVSSIEELMMGLFDFVIKDPNFFRATVKMMLTEGVPDPDPEYYDACCEQGPPGTEFIAQILQKESKKILSKPDLEWAVRSIFGVWFHWCTLCSTSKMRLNLKNDKSPLTIESVRQEIGRTITAIKMSLFDDK